jgi:hypothetical protein
LAGRVGRLLVFLQGLGRAEAPVGLAFAHQLVGMLLVERKPFRLGWSVLSCVRDSMLQQSLLVGRVHTAPVC